MCREGMEPQRGEGVTMQGQLKGELKTTGGSAELLKRVSGLSHAVWERGQFHSFCMNSHAGDKGSRGRQGGESWPSPRPGFADTTGVRVLAPHLPAM